MLLRLGFEKPGEAWVWLGGDYGMGGGIPG